MQMRLPRASGEAEKYCRPSNLVIEPATVNLAWREISLVIQADLNVGRWLWHQLKATLTNGNGEGPFLRQNLSNGIRVLDLVLVRVAGISAARPVAPLLAKALRILANGGQRNPWRRQSDLTEVCPELLSPLLILM